MKKLIIILMMFAAVVIAQEEKKSVDWSLDYQLRSELDGRDFYNATYPMLVTTMRTRVGAIYNISDKVQFFAQLQDSRLWGQGGNTGAYLDNVDMHQAYIQIANAFALPLTVKAGRFKYSFGTERLFGNSDWGYFGRSYDGLLLSYRSKWNADFLTSVVRENENYVGNATAAAYAYPSTRDNSSYMASLILWGKLNEQNNLSFIALYELDRNVTVGTESTLDRYSLNVNHDLKMDNLSTQVEVIYQGGTKAGKDLAAYFFSVDAKYAMGKSTLNPGIDYVSGTDPAELTKNNSYESSFGTGHKFHGFMDYFTSLPANTGNLGLMDIFVGYELKPDMSDFSYALKFHNFNSAVKSAAGESAFGQELDITVTYAVQKGINLVWGGSAFFAGDLMKTRFAKSGNTSLDPAFWSYLMIKAKI